MGVPANAQTIWNSLKRYPFSDIQCAGILGNIEQESTGDPEAGGGGLFQFNPPGKCPGCYTGNVNQDIDAQVTAMVLQGGSGAMVGATSAGQAASMFMTNFEKCDPAQCNEANRVQSANDSLQAAQSGNWKASDQAGNTGAKSTSGTCSDMTTLAGGKRCIICITNPIPDTDDWCLWRVSTNKAVISGLAVAAGGFIVGAGVILLAIWGLHDTRPGQQVSQSAKRAASGAVSAASVIAPEARVAKLATGAKAVGRGASAGGRAVAARVPRRQPKLATGVEETATEIQSGAV